jgi:hypothetical protein
MPRIFNYSVSNESFFYEWGGTFGTAATIGLLYQLQMTGEGDCGKIGRTEIGRVN